MWPWFAFAALISGGYYLHWSRTWALFFFVVLARISAKVTQLLNGGDRNYFLVFWFWVLVCLFHDLILPTTYPLPPPSSPPPLPSSPRVVGILLSVWMCSISLWHDFYPEYHFTQCCFYFYSLWFKSQQQYAKYVSAFMPHSFAWRDRVFHSGAIWMLVGK